MRATSFCSHLSRKGHRAMKVCLASPRLWIAFATFCVANLASVSVHGQSETFKVNNDKEYKIDAYPSTPATTKRPVVVLVHGVDGMAGASGKQITSFAQELEKQGYSVFVPHYFGDDDKAVGIEELIKVATARMAKRGDYLPIISAAIDHAMKRTDADSGKLALVG